MNYRRLGRTGLKVSEVCLGTMTFGAAGWGNNEAESDAIFNFALDAGINFYDVANSYAEGQSETILGPHHEREAGQTDYRHQSVQPDGNGHQRFRDFASAYHEISRR